MKKKQMQIAALAMAAVFTAGSMGAYAQETEEGMTPYTKGMAYNMEETAQDERVPEGGQAEYDGSVLRLARDEAIELALGYEPWADGRTPQEGFQIFQDAGLQYPLEDCNYEWDYDTKILTIAPPFYGVAEIDGSDAQDVSDLTGTYVYGDEISAWGTLQQYYMVSYVDRETGAFLETPQITVLKIQTEIAGAPQLRFDQTEIGEARFTWQAVPGADEYLIFTLKKWDNGYDSYVNVIGRTSDTEWICAAGELEDAEDARIQTGLINDFFVQYYQAEGEDTFTDDFLEELDEETLAMLKELDEAQYDEYWQDYFGVIAVNGEGSSAISNLLSAEMLCHALPHTIAYNSTAELSGVEGTKNLPSVMGVTMCDGSLSWKIIDYDFENIVKNEDSYEITAVAHGTPFSWPISVFAPNWETLTEDLEAIRKRQEELRSRAGNVDTNLTFEETTEAPVTEEMTEEPQTEKATEAQTETVETEEATEEPETEAAPAGMREIHVTANSGISAHMAKEMLTTAEEIDLSAFAEAADMDVVTDAFFEAKYQNPLVLGVQGANVDMEKRVLYVTYDDEAEVTAEKQETLRQRVDEILSEIITPDMSEMEKELAINHYLCDTITYDYDALDNAAQYDYSYVDPQYNDSFTAYGALVDGVCVCAGYSAAFKLLADGAGLDSVVVTGYLEGSLSHAWNKVKVDGTWNIVDVTNNDNEEIPNALLNLSDTAASATLIEDDRFAMDDSVSDYEAPTDDSEYYRVTESYFSEEEAAQALAGRLSETQSAMIRTAYDLDDEAFARIAQEAANASGLDLAGYYWLGVISLSAE